MLIQTARGGSDALAKPYSYLLSSMEAVSSAFLMGLCFAKSRSVSERGWLLTDVEGGSPFQFHRPRRAADAPDTLVKRGIGPYATAIVARHELLLFLMVAIFTLWPLLTIRARLSNSD